MTPLYRQPYRPVASRTPRSIAALRSTVPVASKNSEIGITPVIKHGVIFMMTLRNMRMTSKKVRAYDQEIPQSHTADRRKSHRTSTVTRHKEDNLSKATSSLFPIKMIAKLERTQVYVLHSKNKDQTQNHHKQVEQQLTINKESTTKEPPP